MAARPADRALRHVEALRSTPRRTTAHYPASLSEVSVPLPDDPFSGKPFRYELAGKRPTSAAPPSREEKNRI